MYTAPSEAKTALAKLNKIKASRPDGIVEILAALDNFDIIKIISIINLIYNSGEIPEDLIRSISISLPKMPVANEYDLHRTNNQSNEPHNKHYNPNSD